MPATMRESQDPSPHRLPVAMIVILIASALFAVAAQTLLQSSATATIFFSTSSWQRIVGALGGAAVPQPNGQIVVDLPLGPLFFAVLLFSITTWLTGAWWISRRTGWSVSASLGAWGAFGWLWGIFAGSWEVARIAAFATGFTSLEALLLGTPHFWLGLAGGGWMATLCMLAGSAGSAQTPLTSGSAPAKGAGERTHAASVQSHRRDGYRIPLGIWILMAVYVVVFTAMNWQLYRALLLPHGDSAMYEEHLWNFSHGKGFRSYLDQGLFLGEHVQVVHLFLLPIYLLWPSHLLLELCQSAILATGAIPVFWLARRHTGSALAGTCLGAAYLLYFPLQFLDIAIDLKTFRPNAFGVPMVLFALDQFERRNYKSMIVWLLLTLTAQEDWAIILACLGAWIALKPWLSSRGAADKPPSGTRNPKLDRLLGLGIALFNFCYLVLATRVIILWFRDWKEIHYAGYFSKFGKSLTEVVWNMATNPVLLYQELFTTQTVVYILAVLLPLGFVPLLSPGRLAVGVPVFVTLCLNEVARDPRHHFHAPIVPIIFWAAAAGLGNVGSFRAWLTSRLAKRDSRPIAGSDESVQRFAAHFTWTCALASGLFLSLSPLGLTFWDPGSAFYWRNLYVPGQRAVMAKRVVQKIPTTAKVASTDFIHPRFTHYERSYDYSDYPRAVSNYELKVPDDTDYIVIDTRHPYSKIRSPDQLREYRDHKDEWELLPDDTDGYFIVLKRRRSDTEPAGN
ncbi:MAG: DUF2079 domain-containing protein [Planctomycetaceae bacterium]